MPEHEYDYFVIGNSAAGIAAVESIRAHDAEGTIAMASVEPYRAYGRPLISYVLDGTTGEDSIWLKPKGFYDDARIETFFGAAYEVVALRADAHEADFANGETIRYGTCLLATGSVPFVPPIEGLDSVGNVHSFMTLDDAKGLAAAATAAAQTAAAEERASTAVVVGAGLIGLKAAESLSHFVDRVVVLELAGRILPAVLDEEGASLLQEGLKRHGIECLPGVSMERLVGDACGMASKAVLTDGTEVACDVVVAAVGVRPNSALAQAAGADAGRGLVCDERLRTSLPDVYAAGDVVQVRDVLDGSKHPLALWPNAVRQGRLAGLQMAGAAEAQPFEGSFAVNAVDFFDMSLLTAGTINPSDGSGLTVEVRRGEGTYAKFVADGDRLVGYILLNRPANAGIYTSIIENAVPLGTLSADVFDDAPQNLDFPEKERFRRMHRGYPSCLDERGWKEG